ncbi:hypothetical protein BKA62DRAFT_62968 [Auriculariales sp. MPI-PUGE-AT-0066]|nr:hypothetical protein BKA62DRAFT_62968 [Auriculariales sp. MPI-PUGE-AT-0066]
MPVPRPTRLPTPDERAARAFARLDVLSQGEIGGGTLLPFFMDSGIPVHSLAEIWDKADANVDGSLTLEEFTLAYKLILDQRPTFDPASAIPVDTADSQLISWDGSSPGARHSIYVAPDSLLDEDHEEQQQLARLQARPAPSLPVDRPVSRLEERPLPPTPPPMVGTANLARREMDLPALPVPSQYNQDNATIALRLMVPEVLSIEDDELPPLPASPIPRSASGSSSAHRRTTSTSPAGRSPIASPSPSRHQRSQSARVPSSSPSSGSPVAQGSPQPSSQVRRSATTAAGRLSPGGADVDVRRSMHEVALETVLPPDLPAETEPPPAYTAQLGAGEQAMEVRFS